MIVLDVHCRSDALSGEKKLELWKACNDLRSVSMVNQILCEVKPEQLPELILWKGTYWGRTALECCLGKNNEESILSIIEHVIANEPEFDLISATFPYSGCVTSTNLSYDIWGAFHEDSVTLTEAILQKYPDQTSKLLQAQTNLIKKTILHVTCEHGTTGMVKTVLQSSGDKTTALLMQDGSNMIPLHSACKGGHFEKVLFLLESFRACPPEVMKEALMKPDNHEMTALHLATEGGHGEIVSVLLESLHTCSTEVRKNVLIYPDQNGRSVFHLACYKGKSEIMTSLLSMLRSGSTAEEIKDILLQKDCNNKTMLHLACWQGQTEIVSALLDCLQECGVEALVDALIMEDGLSKRRRQTQGNTPFHLARHPDTLAVMLRALHTCGKQVMTKLLLKPGWKGGTALQWSCKDGYLEIVSVLLDSLKHCGVYVMKEAILLHGIRGKTCLHLASERGHGDILSLLVASLQPCGLGVIKEALTAYDNRDMTPLLWATCGGHAAAVSCLLKAAESCGLNVLKDVLQQDASGQNAFQISCERGYSEVVSTLLNSLQTCSIDVMRDAIVKKDSLDMTPLHWSCKNEHSAITTALLDKLQCCKPEDIKHVLLLQDICDQTALDYAITTAQVQPIFSIALLAVRDRDTYRRLKLLSYHRENSDRNPFAEFDQKSWEFVLNQHLRKIEESEDGIAKLKKAIEDVGEMFAQHNDNTTEGHIESARLHEQQRVQQNMMKNEEENLGRYTTLLKHLPLICAERNKYGESAYCYEDLLPLHDKLLDRCKACNMDDNLHAPFKNIFPSFVAHQAEKISYSKAYPLHPLTVIGESNHLALIKHPYVVTCVNAFWFPMAQYIFYFNLALYMLYLVFLSTFFATHAFAPNGDMSIFNDTTNLIDANLSGSRNLDIGYNLLNNSGLKKVELVSKDQY